MSRRQPAMAQLRIDGNSGTGLGKLAIPRFIIARVLNHADRTVTGIYDRYEYLDEKRHALETWGTYIEHLIAPSDANVVPLRAVR